MEITEIETVEKAFSIQLPQSYKYFLNLVNGGMILENNIHFYTDMTEWEPDGPKWRSFYFYTLSELKEKYYDLKFENGLFVEDFDGIFPLIPICNTPKQNTILLVSQKGHKKESPVFITTDIEDINTYVQIADNFHSFIGTLVENKGFPELTCDEGNPLMSIFLYDNKIVDIATKKETNEEIIKRTTASIILDPKSEWDYLERGNAYEDLGLRQKALADFNQAIVLESNVSFFYYCRGNLIYEYGSARKALIDMDIAVKFDPKDKLYRNGRAKIFLKLGKLEEALTDCNIILKEDGVYELALTTRCKVYGAMGEFEKADDDSTLLDDIYS